MMPHRLKTVSILTLLIASGSTLAMADDIAYASIRVVREQPGEPSRPQINLPEGYELHTDRNYEVASRGEYYVFLSGPEGVAEGVVIDWGDVPIRAIIHNNTRLPLDREGEGRGVVDLPVEAESLRAAWPTLEVHRHFHEPGLLIRIEHNHPDRAAGFYADREWVGAEAQAAINYVFASRQIIRDWGLAEQIDSEDAGRLALMGFETNNPLHGDDPAHWHWIYYLPPEDDSQSLWSSNGSQIPHFYLDGEGRITSNAHDVFGAGRTWYEPCEPIAYTDREGETHFVVTIREDGGVDVGPSLDEVTYTIVPGETGNFVESVDVLRAGEPWIRVACHDDVNEGVLSVRIEPLEGEGDVIEETYRYDPLTGMPRTE